MPIEKWTPIIGVIVSVMALIFQLTAFASNGWSITTIRDTTYRGGLWYVTTCVENKGCETSSWYEKYADNRDGVYVFIVQQQVTLTMGVALSIVCVILTVEALCRSMNDKRRRLVVILSSLLSCTFWFYEVGYGLKRYDSDRKLSREDGIYTPTVYFPWSLFSALIGAQFMLVLCSIYLTIECRSENFNNHQTDRTQDGNQSYVTVTVPNVIYST